jgi:hypothetical protein
MKIKLRTAQDMEPGDDFIQPDGGEARTVTGKEWVDGALEIASVPVDDPSARGQVELFAASDALELTP